MPNPTRRDVHVNQPLTRISIAYRNESYIAEQVFPSVPVTKQSDVYFVFDKQSWFRNRSGPRAPGTRAQRADYGITTASYICVNDALAKEIPDEVRDNADAPLKPDITATQFVTDGLQLALELRVATVVTACANWASASNPSVLWSDDTSNPWANIDTCVNAVVKQIGRTPNVAVMSWDVWRYLRQHPDFLDRVKYTRNTGRVEVSDLQGWFGFDKVLVGTAIYDSVGEGKTASQGFVWGNMFWCGFVTPTPALEMPTAGYVLKWGDIKVERFREEEEHQDVVAAEWYTAEKISASDSGAIMSTVV
jgi:hypothetical protein